MDAAQESGDGRRRGKKNRGRLGKRKRPNKGHEGPRSSPPDKIYEGMGDDTSILGRRVPRTDGRRPFKEEGPPSEFALFCAYHLGITAADGYQKVQVDEVARRFGHTVETLRGLLRQNRLDEETMRKARFDLEGAQCDIRVAPEGISRTEIARDLYDDFLAARERLAVPAPEKAAEPAPEKAAEPVLEKAVEPAPEKEAVPL
jgi:hypothetical protein